MVFLMTAILAVVLAFPAQAGTKSKKKDTVYIQVNGLYVSETSVKVEWRANLILVKKFFQEHDNIKLKMLTNLTLPGEMNVQGADMTMSMVGDAAPDMFWMQSQDLAKAVDQEFLMPLDDYVNRTPEMKKRLTGAVLEMCSSIGPDGKKHIYALPFAVGASCLTYSKKRFREAGLVDSHGNTIAPRDWNDMWEFGKKLYDADKDPETGFPKHWAIQLPLEGWFFDKLPAYAGGEPWRQNADGTWQTLVNSKPCVRSLEFLKMMSWKPWTDPKGRRIKGVMQIELMAQSDTGQSGSPRSALKIEGKDLQATGIVAMTLDSLYSNFNERMAKDPNNYGICPFPKYPGPEGKYANRVGGTLIGIKSTIKDQRVKDAVWTFVSYLCGEQGEREKTKIFVDNGVARYVNPELLRKYGYSQDVIDQVPPEWARTYKQIFSKAYSVADPPGLTSIEMELRGPCREILRNENLDCQKALDNTQNIIARSYLYNPSPTEWARNKRVAWAVVIFLMLVMIASSALILRTQVRENLAQEREKVYARKVPRSKQLLAWILMAPAIISVLLWQYAPVAWGSVMAFQKVHILGGSEWVWMDNFIRVAMRPLFWLAWKNTIIYVVMYLVMAFGAPILLALLLSEIPKGKTLFRTLYYLPALTTGVVTTLLWMQFYDGTEYGLINRVVMGVYNVVFAHINQLAGLLHIPLHIPKPAAMQWLQDPRFAMAATILPSIWAGMGPGCIIYLAALKAVPEEQYDAADLDGAGVIQKTRHVTLPTIFPLVLINFVGAFIGAFHSSGNILIMTGGGPNHATHVMGLEIFFQGYVLANYGQTTAIAWILGSLLIGFAVLQMKIFARMKFSTAEKQGE